MNEDWLQSLNVGDKVLVESAYQLNGKTLQIADVIEITGRGRIVVTNLQSAEYFCYQFSLKGEQLIPYGIAKLKPWSLEDEEKINLFNEELRRAQLVRDWLECHRDDTAKLILAYQSLVGVGLIKGESRV